MGDIKKNIKWNVYLIYDLNKTGMLSW